MPVFTTKDGKYNIPDSQVDVFLADYPDAKPVESNTNSEGGVMDYLSALAERVKPGVEAQEAASRGDYKRLLSETLFKSFGTTSRAIYAPIATAGSEQTAGDWIREGGEGLGTLLAQKLKGIPVVTPTLGVTTFDTNPLLETGANVAGDPTTYFGATQAIPAISRLFKSGEKMASVGEKVVSDIAQQAPKQEDILEQILKNAEGDLDPVKTGRSALLKNKVVKANVVGNQDAVAEIRGPAMKMDQMKQSVEMLPPEVAEKVIQKLDNEEMLNVTERLVLGNQVASKASDIVSDAINGTLNESIGKLLKSKKQAGQVLRSERDVNDIITSALWDEVDKLPVNDRAKALKFLEEAFDFKKGELNPTKTQMLVEWATMIKLTGLSTHVRALSGNAVMSALSPIERAGAGMMDAFVYGTKRAFGKEATRSVYAREALSKAYGTTKSFKNATHRAWSMLVHPTQYFDEATKAGEVMIKRGAIPGKLGEIVRAPGRLVGAVDAFFKEINYGSEIYALAMRKSLKNGYRGDELVVEVQRLIENPTDDMIAKATDSARERVFQEELGKFNQKVNELRNTKGGVARLVVPFWNTPVNLLKQSVQRTPVSFITPKTWKVLHGSDNAMKYEFISRAITGSAFLSAMAFYAADGNISGRGPKHRSKSNLLRQTGWQPYSIKVGSDWLSYQGFEPLSSWLRVSADMAQGVKEGGRTWPKDMVMSYVKQFAENPFLLGVHDLMTAVDDLERGDTPKVLAGLVTGSTIPVILQQWGTRTYDPVIRQPKGFVEGVKARTPFGVSKDIRPLRNIYGEELTRDNPYLQNLGFTWSYKKGSKIDKELARLTDYGLGIDLPSRKINDIELSDDEYERLIVLKGVMLKEQLDKLINSPSYERLPDLYKVKAVRRVVSITNRFVKSQEFGKYYLGGKK